MILYDLGAIPDRLSAGLVHLSRIKQLNIRIQQCLGEKKELLRGEDSFFSGEPGGVVGSNLALTNTSDEEGEPHIDIVSLSLDDSLDIVRVGLTQGIIP